MSVSKWAYRPEVCDRDFCPGVCNRCPKALILTCAQDKLDAITYIMRQVLIVPDHKIEKDGSHYGEWTYKPVKNTSRLNCYEALWQIQDMLETNKWWYGLEVRKPRLIAPPKPEKPKVPLTFTINSEEGVKAMLGILGQRGVKEAKIIRKDDGTFYAEWEENLPCDRGE